MGKLKSGMVNVLLETFTRRGDLVLDPFCGSGVVPLESILMGRATIASDLSPYAYVVTLGKLSAPSSRSEALHAAEDVLAQVDELSPRIHLASIPEWVIQFFHPRTLQETLAAFQILKKREDYFLTACLLGILHHVRPGFLSYPASHLTPYLRTRMYPPESQPQLYSYRDLRSRLLAKVERAYRRPDLDEDWGGTPYKVFQVNAMLLPIKAESIDAIISSPPYFGALDYARDNRLRLWFLGVPDWRNLDKALTANQKVYIPQMTQCVAEMNRVLRPGKYCVLVLGDVYRDGTTRNTAEVIAGIAHDVSHGQLVAEGVYSDEIPDIRRSRRRTRTTKIEKILVLKKRPRRTQLPSPSFPTAVAEERLAYALA
ncbi:MAG: hypothetical protein Q8P22_08030 [Chloroflexota bacterium]|nr:hypothetical protein [Chloroflexota bacterium]